MRTSPCHVALSLAVCLLTGWLSQPVATKACCSPSVMPCEAYWTASAVFVGRVVSVTRSGAQRIVSLDVVEAFRGVSSSRVEVGVANLPSSCPLALKVGGEYAIYAERSADRLAILDCNRSGPVADAGADLAYAREVRSGVPAPGFVGGAVVGGIRTISGQAVGGTRTVPTTTVSVTKDGVTETTTTDIAGHFRVPTRGPGRYRISVNVPERFYTDAESAEITLGDGRACANRSIVLYEDGGVDGRVVNSEGRPVGGLTLELATAHRSSSRRFVTDRHGRYRLTRVPAGAYILSVPAVSPGSARHASRVYFPGVLAVGSAKRITLGGGDRVELPDFTIPAASTFVPLSGVVLDADGRPAEGARVFLKGRGNDDRILAEPVVADFMGQFTIAALAGAEVQVFAERVRSGSRTDASDATPIDVRPGVPPIRLTLARRY